MKKLLVLSSELLSLIVLGFLLGRFLDNKFLLNGWATIVCLVLAYVLWFFNFYKSFQKRKNANERHS